MILRANNLKSKNKTLGFTIVELLVVIVLVGILAAITIVSYIGITAKANESTLISDLSNNSKKLSMYNAQYGEYPFLNSSTNCPMAPSVVDKNYCLKFSSGNTSVYTYKTPKSYGLSATKNSVTYEVSESTSPAAISLAQPSTCPTGFIPVPGSATYGTSGFCVMKYEAKNAGNNVSVSTATGTPWVNISQTDALVYASNAAGCTGCHLISEAEWMTLVKNILSVSENWSGGSVGSGYVFSGHNDNAPASALVADVSDTNGYVGTGNFSGDVSVSNSVAGNTQKRTLTLTNGEIIWDVAGNVWEWTSGQTASGFASQPGVVGNTYSGWVEFSTLNATGTLPVDVTPAGTGLTGANSWTGATRHIGQLYSNPVDIASHGFLRGGDWGIGSLAGVLLLDLYNTPDITRTYLGFRAVK